MTITSLNRKLAVQPIKDSGLKIEKINGLAISFQSNATVTTTLLFDAEVGTGASVQIIPAGSKISFLGTAEKAPWNRLVLKHEGQEFVLAPVEEAIFVTGEE